MDNKTKIKAIKNPIFYIEKILGIKTGYIKMLESTYDPIYKKCKMASPRKNYILEKIGEADLGDFIIIESQYIKDIHSGMLEKYVMPNITPDIRTSIMVAEPDADMITGHKKIDKREKHLIRKLCDIMDSDRDVMLSWKLDKAYDGKPTSDEYKELFGFDPEEMRESYLAQKGKKKDRNLLRR